LKNFLKNFSCFSILYKSPDNTTSEVIIMKKYICPCGYVYDEEKGDPEHGVAPGTKWEDVPEDWLCPTCGIGKDMFQED
jgi:rubredoxin